MSYSRFSIIVAIDSNNGIALNGKMPWHNTSDMNFFRETTTGRGKNVVVMGRRTYDTIPTRSRPLSNRRCCVLSKSWNQESNLDVSIYSSIPELLTDLGISRKRYDHVFVIGGESVYKQFLSKYLYLCDKIYVTKFRDNYQCDKFFSWDEVKKFRPIHSPSIFHSYTRFCVSPDMVHGEKVYLDLLREIIDTGEVCSDRTGVGTQALFGRQLRFDIRSSIPILTTKKVRYADVIKELLFFIAGQTDTSLLDEQNVRIWKENTSSEFLKTRGLDYKEGDMGPMYGHQWRRSGATYKGCKSRYEYESDEGVDQLQSVIDSIKTDPHSRRHLICSWSAADISQMVLAPCHFACQFHVSGNGMYLDCLVSQRSADCFLGLPYNIASYSILTYMIAHLCDLQPRELIFSLGDAHIYTTHFPAVAQQVVRDPKPFPQLVFKDSRKIHKIDDFNFNNIIVKEYDSWASIKAKMAI